MVKYLSLWIFYFFFHTVMFFSILLIKTNSSWLIFELIKALEIKTSMLFKFCWQYYFIMVLFLFLNYLPILFNSCYYCTNFSFCYKLVIPIWIPRKDTKAEFEIHPVIAETKIIFQHNLELHKLCSAFYSSIRFALFLQGND